MATSPRCSLSYHVLVTLNWQLVVLVAPDGTRPTRKALFSSTLDSRKVAVSPGLRPPVDLVAVAETADSSMVAPQAIEPTFWMTKWNLRSPVLRPSYQVLTASNWHAAEVLAPVGEKPTR